MFSRELQFIARQPRHLGAKDPDLQCFVLRDGESTDTADRLELVDFSRLGVGVTIAEPRYVNGETVTVVLSHATSRFEFRSPAEVRWQRRNPSGGWLLGCRFATEVTWETLGEMFLNGLLSRER